MLWFIVAHAVAAVALWAATGSSVRGAEAATDGAVPSRPGTMARAAITTITAAPLLATLVWLVSQAGGVLDGEPVTTTQHWVSLSERLDVVLRLRLDGFGLLFAGIVSGMGLLIVAYARSYFGSDGGFERFAPTFVAFAGAMTGVVLADDVLTLFVFWELTSVTSFLLIGFDDRSAEARASALRAFLVTGAGGLALLGGLVLLAREAGTTQLSALLADPPTGAAVEVALLCVLLGAFTKSAQVPFHFWLPGAMKAPTPVSAYLHSATMVKAGVVVVARFSTAFAPISTLWRPLVVVVGTVTLLWGGWRSLRQVDAKLVLAHGTVSQLGLLMVLFGLGTPGTTYAATAMLAAHAVFKGALFMVVGIVDHSTHTRDLRTLSGVGSRLPALAAIAVAAGASMAGAPPLLGFVAKEKALDQLVHADAGIWGPVALVGMVAGSALTVAYTWRFLVGTFGTKPTPAEPTPLHAPTPTFLAPAALLALASLAGGLAAGPVGSMLADVSVALDPASAKKLALWAGVNVALGLSALVLAVGVAIGLFLMRRLLAGNEARRGPALPSGEQLYQRGLDGLLTTARRTTAIVQNGSLPFYIGVVLLAASVLLAAAFRSGAVIDTDRLSFADGPGQVVVAVIIAVASVAIAVATNRFVAVLLLGIVGYGLTLLFFLYGAPDLALTQLLVETLTVVVFLLALRRLPRRFNEPPSWAPRAVRLVVAGLAGTMVTLFALAAGTARQVPTVAAEVGQLSEPVGGGRNVVNVVLVDTRAADTLGEITVLGLAAIGVANLVLAARRSRSAERRS